MISFNLSALAVLSCGTLKGSDIQVNRVSTDSRDCRDALFVALVGERFDAHDFIDKAVSAGALAVVSQKLLPKEIEDKVSVVYVKSTLKAYGYCGLLVRRQFKGKVASLTGSCGKTTVKEFTQSIFASCGNSICTKGNFNNDVGVPKTLLEIDNSYDYAVIEQGASHLFDNAHTCEFVQADTAVINNVGGAHIEGFGSFDGVYKGKSELLESVLSNGGKAAVPSDSAYFERWKSDYAASFRDGHLFSFGSHEGDLVRYTDVKADDSGINFNLCAQGDSFEVHMNVLGLHNASNAAAACALALLTGAPVSALKEGLSKASTLKGRLCAHSFERFSLIDDAYNASFNAVTAAIDTLSASKGHTVLIFGDMGELGCEAQSLHSKVGEYANDKINEILCVGKLTQYTVDAFKGKSSHFNLHQDLVQYAQNLLKEYDFVTFLVKGSHAMHMDEISSKLLALGERAC